MDYIEFRSDACTHPTIEMREAMINSMVGDDVYEDDPTTIELEKLAAEVTGKEAALLFPSGCMANQCAIMTHTQRCDEIIAADKSHIIEYEQGGAGFLCGVVTRTIDTTNGLMEVGKVEPNIRKGYDVHFPSTRLLCVENPTSNGVVADVQYMKDMHELAKKYGLGVHFDGARVFNASAYLNVDVKELTKYCDTVMFCLSKGLCAPVGSMLCGSEEFIKRARYHRKLLGGGMRQTGVIAGPGLVALKEHRGLLGNDNKVAIYIAEQMNTKLGDYIEFIDVKNIHINMLFFSMKQSVNIDSQDMVRYLKEKGNILMLPELKPRFYRVVTHYYIGEKEANKLIYHIQEYFNQVK